MGHFLDVGAFLNEARSTPKNGHRQFDPLLPKSANERNRSRGRALRHGRASNGWNDESVLADDDEGQKHVPRTDDCSA